MTGVFDDALYREADERSRQLPLTVGALIDLQAGRVPDAPFLKFDETVILYRELPSLVNRLANGLLARGIGPGDRVAVMSSNRPEFTLLWLALSRIGAIEVPVNTAYKGSFLTYTIENSGATHVVVEGQFVERVLEVLPRLSMVSLLTVLSPDPLPFHADLEVVPFSELSVDDASAPDVEVYPDSILAIAYTSGTTGASKGVMLSQGYFCHLGRDCAKYRALDGSDVIYNPMPLFHMNAQTLTVMPALTVGAAVALGRRFSASGFWDQVRGAKATQFNFIGAMISILWQQPPRSDDCAHDVRLAFGGPIPREIFERAHERWGIRLLEAFGSTESGMIAWQPHAAPRAGSLGKAVPEYDVELVDEHDEPVPVGQPGELVSRPRRTNSMMSGYYAMPEKTVEAWRNLWFHTGDVARSDEDGYLYYVDRKTDSMRRRGENISSTELEAALVANDEVREVAVVAVPSELSEDEIKAFLVVDGARDFDYAEFISWCERQLPAYMIPRYVELLATLPKTATERTEKYKLREIGLTPLTWDRVHGGFVDATSASGARNDR
jgi:carnitine-CoA ligase